MATDGGGDPFPPGSPEAELHKRILLIIKQAAIVFSEAVVDAIDDACTEGVITAESRDALVERLDPIFDATPELRAIAASDRDRALAVQRRDQAKDAAREALDELTAATKALETMVAESAGAAPGVPPERPDPPPPGRAP